MEMRRNNTIYKYLLPCMLLLFCLFGHRGFAQVPINTYSISNGKMFIAIGKDIPKETLDNFISKYELYDLDLPNYLKTGSPDSLKKLGWKIELNNSEVFIISKKLFSADNVNDPGDKIIFTQKGVAPGQAAPVEPLRFGYNRFKNKQPFAVVDSTVTFFLRGNTQAGRVMLAGSFNNWQDNTWPMTLTDSGWITRVQLPAGKHWYKFVVDGNWIIDKDNSNIENDGLGNDNSVYYKANYVFNLDGYTNAKRVYLAGSFNGWAERDLLMQKTPTGWTLPVYLAEGTHTYRFIADRRWITDPGNPDKLPNEFNEFNSVVRIGKPYLFKLDGYTDAKKVTVKGSFNNWMEDELQMTKTPTGWELPYTLGAGNYEYKFVVDGKDNRVSKNNLQLVIGPNFTFRLKGYENAKTVFLAGDLNNWNPASFAMQRVGDEWIFKAHLDKGKHRYKFVVDGEWILDPANKLWEQNEHNTGNSIVWIDTEQ